MAIKPSAGRQIDALIAQLSSDSVSTREAAVARLTVLGARTVDKLIALVESGAPGLTRAAALQTLEAIASPRAIDVALNALDDHDPAVAAAAVSTAQTFLDAERGADVIDRRHPGRPRSASSAGPEARRDPGTLDAQVGDAEAAVDAPRAGCEPAGARAGAGGGLPGAGGTARFARVTCRPRPRGCCPTIRSRSPAPSLTAAASIPLPLLQRLVDRIREHEAAEPSGREEWAKARAAAHLALAGRGSRLALYDLRESLERAAAPLPVEFLAALSQIGDASCLEAIAAAYVQAPGSSRGSADWWRRHLARAFHTIVKREGLTRRHQLIRKIAKRWGDAAQGLSDPARGGTALGRAVQ